MHGKVNNNLIVIENGQLNMHMLDDRLAWELGRQSKDYKPDIKLYSTTVSRRHGRFENTDGYWFYMDYNGKNGTAYNGRRIEVGINGRLKPVMLADGDVFIFGGGDKPALNYKTVWAMFSTHFWGDRWRVADTKDYEHIILTDGVKTTRLNHPARGTVIEKDNGMGIYMGDLTYLIGDAILMEG